MSKSVSKSRLGLLSLGLLPLLSPVSALFFTDLSTTKQFPGFCLRHLPSKKPLGGPAASSLSKWANHIPSMNPLLLIPQMELWAVPPRGCAGQMRKIYEKVLYNVPCWVFLFPIPCFLPSNSGLHVLSTQRCMRLSTTLPASQLCLYLRPIGRASKCLNDLSKSSDCVALKCSI